MTIGLNSNESHKHILNLKNNIAHIARDLFLMFKKEQDEITSMFLKKFLSMR